MQGDTYILIKWRHTEGREKHQRGLILTLYDYLASRSSKWMILHFQRGEFSCIFWKVCGFGNKTKPIVLIWHGNFKLLLMSSLDSLESYGILMMRMDCRTDIVEGFQVEVVCIKIKLKSRYCQYFNWLHRAIIWVRIRKFGEHSNWNLDKAHPFAVWHHIRVQKFSLLINLWILRNGINLTIY